VTVRHRGAGVKRLYRIVDFGQIKIGLPAKVIALEYDPYRTAFLMLLEYKDGEKSYQLAPHSIKIGDEVICQESVDIKVGNRLKLKNIPVGTIIYNIEIEPGRGGKMAKSAGSAATVLAQEGKFTHLSMPSGEVRKLLQDCYASIGQVSNPEKRFEIIGKAGRMRLKGWRPTVRGSAMIPPDHPHGGGEGKTPIGMKFPKTPWGKPARGVKTRNRHWTDKFIIQRRQK
jgi:large subunit ribosomal protein L2